MPRGFKATKRGLDQLQKELQKELNKRPVSIPVEGQINAPGPRPDPATVHNYTGPVFQGDARGAQLAWGNTGDVHQQVITTTVTPGYEPLAQVIAELRRRIDDLGLGDDDREDAIVHADEVLAEIVQDEPEQGPLRRALRALVRILTPIATGAATGTSEGVQEWTKEWTKTVIAGLILPT